MIKCSINTLLVIITVFSLILTGCDSQIPIVVQSMSRPVTVLACNDNGVVLQGSDGKAAAYSSSFYFAKILISEGYEKGDILFTK